MRGFCSFHVLNTMLGCLGIGVMLVRNVGIKDLNL